MPMKLIINNKEVVSFSTTLSALLAELSIPEKGIAIAVNNKVLPRAEWGSQLLCDGDCIIIIRAVCGG